MGALWLHFLVISYQDVILVIMHVHNKLWFENYVEAGGLLDIHIATYGEQPVLPGGCPGRSMTPTGIWITV